jgi:hypothetical protein
VTVDPATVRAAMTPVVQAAVLDAFKLGVGHAIRAIEGQMEQHRGRPYGALEDVAMELRAYVATMTYEDLP